uniref:Alpha-2A adrenergic receptor n=1 Tax=Phallusia mammillata TaxID=59560 RepID=A0A6F9D6T1_9ASCI|nr:alpha-2A adrenergic receptor [Phallusia mammillata]
MNETTLDTPTSFTELLLKPNGSNCLGSTPVPGENSTIEQVFLTIACMLFCLVGFLGNVAVIIVICKDRVISRHKQNLYLLSLAVADAALVVLVVPFSFANEILHFWPFGSLYCRIYLSVDIMLCTASIWNICFIGIDRYVSVAYPTTYRKFRTVSRIRLCILFIWGYSATLSLLPFFSGETKKIHGEESCFINDSSWFIILSTSLSFFIPALIVWPVYLKIYLVGRNLEIKRRARRSSNIADDKTASHSKNSHSWRSKGKEPMHEMADVHKRDCAQQEETRSLLKTDEQKNQRAHNRNGSKASSHGHIDNLSTSRNFLKPTDALTPICNNNFGSGRDNSLTHHSMARFDKRTSSTTTTTSYFTSPRVNGVKDIYGEHHAKSFYNECMKNICCSNESLEDVKEPESFVENGKSEAETGRLSVSHAGPSISSVTSKIKRNRLNRESFTSQTSTCTAITRRERRFVMIISIVMGCFMACWLPFFSTYLVYAICRESCCIDDQLFKVFFWLGYLNSAVNPILYTIFNKDFRRAFRRLFSRQRIGV